MTTAVLYNPVTGGRFPSFARAPRRFFDVRDWGAERHLLTTSKGSSDGGTSGDGGKLPSNNHATVKINGVDEAVTGFTSFASGSGVVLAIKLNQGA